MILTIFDHLNDIKSKWIKIQNESKSIGIYTKSDEFYQKWIKIHQFLTSSFNWRPDLSSDFESDITLTTKLLQFKFKLMTIGFVGPNRQSLLNSLKHHIFNWSTKKLSVFIILALFFKVRHYWIWQFESKQKLFNKIHNFLHD